MFAFNRTGLESVVFPASLRKISDCAFVGCRCLKRVKFSEGLEVLGTDEYPDSGSFLPGAFERCALEHVELPSTLKRIEYSVFKWCKSLRSIDLPEQFEYIGEECFYGSALETIRFPPSLKTVGKDAF